MNPDKLMKNDEIMDKLSKLSLKLAREPLSGDECAWLIETCSSLARHGLSLTRVMITQSGEFQEAVQRSSNKFPKEQE